ncbi:unnamed protein product [Leptosia nina]|uniref:Uncharacterized protein n=1 Tax=Leptosia nina TaxID=320188 RepID=A0AAV1K4Z0_9NEOP
MARGGSRPTRVAWSHRRAPDCNATSVEIRATHGPTASRRHATPAARGPTLARSISRQILGSPVPRVFSLGKVYRPLTTPYRPSLSLPTVLP